MAYPRRNSSGTLAQPRPFFLADENRNSWGSSADSASDSEPVAVPVKRRQHRKRSSMAAYPDDWDIPTRSPSPTLPPRPPPSSFAFPFQAYPGNPDPGTAIPGYPTRRSFESLSRRPSLTHDDSQLSHSGSLTDLRRPIAPFMQDTTPDSSSSNSLSQSSNSIYRSSAAAATASPTIPRNPSTHSFRAPFLSPASRASYSLWSPPAYNTQLAHDPTASTSALATPASFAKPKPPALSTRLPAPLTTDEKPWLQSHEPRTRRSYFITLTCLFLGLAGAAALCYFNVTNINLLPSTQLCLIMDDDFTSGSLNDDNWSKDVQLGGFGNGEFEMTTNSDSNLFFQNDQLYIYPTLTSSTVPNTLDGGNYTLDGCTVASTNASACSASSSSQLGTVINPVMSARINTKGKKSITYGKVEIRAKLPRGDWLWPAIWMLPETDTYGPWPISGEIDILEARGNGPSYPAQGSNFVRSSLNYGPLPSLYSQIFGWQSSKRSSFDGGFHTYTLEWTDKFMRFYLDRRTQAMLEVDKLDTEKRGFWGRGKFPATAQNGSAQVVVENPWSGRGNSAPFDQPFYLIINLAAGGTSGWFPDNKGGKPWYDESLTAMRDFARAQDTWSATWPESQDDRSLRIDYVKMWQKC